MPVESSLSLSAASLSAPLPSAVLPQGAGQPSVRPGTLESKYAILETAASGNPDHFRARIRSSGAECSVFVFRSALSPEWTLAAGRANQLLALGDSLVMEVFRSGGRPVIVTQPVPAGMPLMDQMDRAAAKSKVSAAAPGGEWARVRERFLTPQQVVPEVAAPTSLAPAPAAEKALAVEKPAKRTVKAVASELDIFEARTVRIDLPAEPVFTGEPEVVGQLDFQAPPKLYAAGNAAPLARSTYSDNEVIAPPSPIGAYILYATGLVALAVAVTAYLLQ